MDFVKETHDLLNHYLGEPHRGSKQLGHEHQELKAKVCKLVLYALRTGQVQATHKLQEVLYIEQKALSAAFDKQNKLMYDDMINQKYVRPSDEPEREG